MSKLLKLKKWLTVPEAAERLSTILEDKATEADVFRLALDGHLVLSLLFVEPPWGMLYEDDDPFEVAILDEIVDVHISSRHTRQFVMRELLRMTGRPCDGDDVSRAVVYSKDSFPGAGGLYILIEEAAYGSYLMSENTGMAAYRWGEHALITSDQRAFDIMTELPSKCMFVIRTEALRDFEQRLADQEEQAEQEPVEEADKKMAAMFDPVRVDELERLFPTGKWGAWTNNAKRYPALHIARTAPAQWNPYLAAQFLRKKDPSWTEERILAALNKALPERSEDKAWMLDP